MTVRLRVLPFEVDLVRSWPNVSELPQSQLLLVLS